MRISVHSNQRACEAAPGMSVFECAEQAGVPVPTSCRNQGRCRECVVEATRAAGVQLQITDTEVLIAP